MVVKEHLDLIERVASVGKGLGLGAITLLGSPLIVMAHVIVSDGEWRSYERARDSSDPIERSMFGMRIPDDISPRIASEVVNYLQHAGEYLEVGFKGYRYNWNA